MDLPFPPGSDPDMLHPAPKDEQERLRRLLAAHARLVPSFGAALPRGSFNGPLARRLGGVPDDEARERVKFGFTFAF